MSLVIALEFTNVCQYYSPLSVEQKGPHEVYMAARTIFALHEKGCKFILSTKLEGAELQEAVKWFDLVGVPLYGINRNPDQKGESPRVEADVYIYPDVLGVDILTNEAYGHCPRPYDPVIDWVAALELIEESFEFEVE
jgi:hypothetical protein